ncbi:MAG: hypothetical protein ACLPKB_22950 [Xanthobacteraceae bacterium]
MRRVALILAFISVGACVARAGPVTFGPGDEPGARVRVVAHQVQTQRAQAKPSTVTALDKTFDVTIERRPSGRRTMRARLAEITNVSVESDDPVVRVAGETELRLIDALRSVPVVFDVNDKGQITGVVDEAATGQALLRAIVDRIGALAAEKPLLHADTALPSDRVGEIDAAVGTAFVNALSKGGTDAFIQSYCDELAFILLVAGERIDIGQSVERPIRARSPADGSLITVTHILSLRATDAGRTKAFFDIKVARDTEALLRGFVEAGLRKQKLGEDEIRRRSDAMPIEWEANGAAEADIATGRMLAVRLNARMRVGAIELIVSEDVGVSTIR